MSKILVIDDDKNLLDVLKYNLESDGFTVVTAEDGIQALETAHREKPDLILLDVMLPGLDGFEICRILRKEMTVPIVMLTAKTQEIDKVAGLELGADDFITKPFSIRELMTRVRVIFRRAQWTEQRQPRQELTLPTNLKANGLEVDMIGHRVFRQGTVVKLSPKEFALLAFLMRNRGQAFSREQLVQSVWGYDYEGTARTVDVHVRSLRTKLEDDPKHPTHLLTIHGLGYKFDG